MSKNLADITVTEIALRILDIQTLQIRNMDRLDFHELGVVSIKHALLAAYEAGTKEKTKH